MWSLRQYRYVFWDFYSGCDEELQAAIDVYLEQLCRLGNRARMPISRYLEGGILECRPRAGKRLVRLLYFFQPGKRIVIVVAVHKDQRKLRRDIIKLAKQRRDEVEAGEVATYEYHESDSPKHRG